MGGISSTSTSDANFAVLQDAVLRHAGTLKRLTTLRYDEFLRCIEHLNNLTKDFCDPHGKRLVFAVKRGTDDTVLWKAMVRIRCIKINIESGRPESSRLLNLKQFVDFYNVITQQVATLASQAESSTGRSTLNGSCSTHCEETGDSEKLGACAHDLEASVLLTTLDSSAAKKSDTTECCICMERQTELLLPCAHQYCLQCIEQWNVTNKTCPICRHRLNSTDDSWVLTEMPDSREMEAELRNYLMNFTKADTG